MSDTYWKVVNAVKEYIEKNNGRRPSIAELCDMTGISSTSHVLYHLLAAVEKGDLIDEGKPRQSRRWAYRHIQA